MLSVEQTLLAELTPELSLKWPDSVCDMAPGMATVEPANNM